MNFVGLLLQKYRSIILARKKNISKFAEKLFTLEVMPSVKHGCETYERPFYLRIFCFK